MRIRNLDLRVPMILMLVTGALNAQGGSVLGWESGTFGLNGLSQAPTALATYDDGSGPALYAGGDFSLAGAGGSPGIARWNGAMRSSVDGGLPGAVEELTAEVTGVVTRACREEREGLVVSALGELDDTDREIIVLRGIEQSSNLKVATLLGISPQASSQRYWRALERLRQRLPASIFEDLPEEG